MPKDSSTKYYQEKKKEYTKYKGFSKEGKQKMQQYGRKRYKNLPEDEKQRLAEYRKKCYKIRKNASL